MRKGAVGVKMCGLTRREDAISAFERGATYAGVVLAPDGKRTVSESAAAAILKDLPILKVGVFVDAGVEDMAAAARTIGLHAIQLHGDESPETVQALRQLGPWEIWKAVRLRSGGDLIAAITLFSSSVDALVLDGWSGAARGGTGTAFDWTKLSPLRHQVPAGVRLVVAGGLTPQNVPVAIQLLSPDVVDVSSGVESSPGIKDPARLIAFLAAAGVNQTS